MFTFALRLVLVLFVGLACRREDRTEAVAAAIRARGPVPVVTSPDGARVLVETAGDRSFHFEVVARRDGAMIASRDDDDPALAPAWRGDGGAIAYFRARGHHHTYDLRIWDFAAGDRSLGVPPTAIGLARWAPDGARLAYLASDAQQRMLTVASVADPLRRRALVSVADHAEFEWSPDGRRLATATGATPGTLTIVEADGGVVAAIPVVDGELQDLAWSPDGSVVAVTGRATEDAYFRVFRVRIADRTIDALAPGAGDAHAPQFIGDELAYDVERDGERRIYLAGRAIGRDDANAHLVGVDHGTPIVVYRPRTGPAYLAAVPLQPGPTDEVPGARGAAASRIEVIARDGVRLPAYLWRARAAVGAVVIVHGGPALHASPAWNEKTQLLVDAGFDVLKLDYRGSTGHGAAFEALGAPSPLPGRIDDVLAARDYAIATLRMAPEHVILLGESYGAGLIAAAASAQVTSPLVLVATLPLHGVTTYAPRCPVLAFHGADDDISLSAPAHAYLEQRFGDALRWRLLASEGHNLARTASWAAVYAAIIALRDAPCQ